MIKILARNPDCAGVILFVGACVIGIASVNIASPILSIVASIAIIILVAAAGICSGRQFMIHMRSTGVRLRVPLALIISGGIVFVCINLVPGATLYPPADSYLIPYWNLCGALIAAGVLIAEKFPDDIIDLYQIARAEWSKRRAARQLGGHPK